MKIVLFEKEPKEPNSMFHPVSNERLIWLIDLIAHIESDKEGAKIRIDGLLSGRIINTELSSFVIRIIDKDL
ncbi:MAG: hypothetical protein LUH21_04160 [Clostridiales bacterium]|nr:hypothetical protein [Clostridiales bacterium]